MVRLWQLALAGVAVGLVSVIVLFLLVKLVLI